MGIRDLFRRGDAAPAEETAPHDHFHDDDGCGPVGPPVPAEAPATRVAPAPSGPPADAVIFRSFPLKLALMQPLMYDEGAVLPAFSLPPSMHPGAPVEDWFRGFTLTDDQVASVTALTLSRTNEVYRQLDPKWAADDTRFDIEALAERDLAVLTGLRSVADPEGMLTDAARTQIEARGVTLS